MLKPTYTRKAEPIVDAQPGSTLLLHSCCGPCSTIALERLGERFAVTVYFYNPNIHPAAEYQRRLDAQKTVAERLRTRYPLRLIVPDSYNPAPFAAAVKGLEAEPEGGARCAACFTFRLEQTAQRAKAEGFDYFATALSAGPTKDATLLNKIGADLEEAYHISYLPADFKKQGGHQRSVALAKELGLYRQNYCGCML